MRALNDAERLAYQYLIDVLTGHGEGAEPALMNVELDGRDVAAIIAVRHDTDDYDLRPLAVLVDDELFARLNPGEH